jgi:alkylhydroperoxidase family enzyme
VLDDYRTAPIDERLRTTLAFLEKLTLDPGAVGPEDIAPMRAAGVSDQAVEEAIYVASLFNAMDRLADAFDFELPRPEHGPRTAWVLTKLGYGTSSVPG